MQAAIIGLTLMALAGCAAPAAPPPAVEGSHVLGGVIAASRPVPDGSPALIATEAVVSGRGRVANQTRVTAPTPTPAGTIEFVVLCDDGTAVSVVQRSEPWLTTGQRVGVAIGTRVSIVRAAP